ncbi:MAG: divalent-cation tolerance protein CutA [Rickettsiaceae bacterium]|nr:divalent-cation tolerance protein CutA [Rickettsiaceae bacterium]MDP5083573.1 divalent-cation tolerance protein CutA [Rickettsiaceae bacterium]
MSKECCVVITTTNNEETAKLIAKTLVESKLAACVQLDEVQSFFYYEAKVEQEKEIRLFIKAPSDNYKSIEKSIKFNHNYQLPQIIKLDITDGLPQYLNWIHGGLRDGI